MAKIGSFGDLVFSVSENTVRTFNDFNWKVSASYATHDRHVQRDVLEFLGPEPEEITFKMAFSVFHGVNPIDEVERLNQMCREGIAARLIIGTKKYGSYKWVVTSVSSEMKRFDNKGNCWGAAASVTLKEYAER